MAGGPLDLWNEWATQILVLLSLTLQVVLLLFAGIRRHEASVVPTFLLWLAYLMADSTAIYALGHLSLGNVQREHQLVAFWAPFLLLHLGGPDNISAYALEDSKLWLRHLQNLVVQVLGASYVLYKYMAGGDSFIFLAAILMFTVGVVKYAERTWALKRSNLDSIRSSLPKDNVGPHHHFHPPDYGSSILDPVEGDEFYVRRAHSMFHICKRAIVDNWVVRVEEEEDSENQRSSEEEKGPESQSLVVDMDIKKEEDNYKGMWTLMEMELSLMYDLLYTKAGVIHTRCGYAIRVASSLTAAASFLLFQFSRSKDDHGRVNVAVSYTLLSGAFLVETASLLRALGSTWTYAFLCNTRWGWLRYAALCTGRWDRLHWLIKVTTGRRGGDKRSARRWSGKIGQYNMLHACSRDDPLLGKLAMMLGFDEWWMRYRYSSTVEFQGPLKEQLFNYTKKLTKKMGLNMQGVIRKDWGKQAFQFHEEIELYETLNRKNYLGVEFQEGIIIWHIATEVLIARSKGKGGPDEEDLVESIRTLSNYLIFLLVDRPYMLPGLGHSMLYRLTRDKLAEMWNLSPYGQKVGVFMKLKDFFSLHDDRNSTGFEDQEKLADILYNKVPQPSLNVPRLYFSCKAAIEVQKKFPNRVGERGRAAMLELLRDVWIDFLVYAANRCSRESHAKKLGNGGELITILWLMTDHLHLQAVNEEEEKRRR